MRFHSLFLLVVFLFLAPASLVFGHKLEQPLPGEQAMIDPLWTTGVNDVEQWTQTSCTGCPPTQAKLLHTKTHACVTGKLQVAANIPASLQVGIFDPANGLWGQNISSIVRFSNGKGAMKSTENKQLSSDKDTDVRGFATKFFIPGLTSGKVGKLTKRCDYVTATCHSDTYDLIMSTAPNFMSKRVDDGSEAMTAGFTGKLVQYLLLHPTTALDAYAMLKSGSIPSLTQGTYYTALPSAMGPDNAAQLRWSPMQCPSSNRKVEDEPEPASANDDPNVTYYHDRLASVLSQGPACFLLEAIPYVSEDVTPVENARVDWASSSKQNWVAMGILTLDQQPLNIDQQFCSELAFNPYNAPVDHEQIGGIARIRRTIYTRVQASRVQYQSGKPFTADITWNDILKARKHNGNGAETEQKEVIAEM